MFCGTPCTIVVLCEVVVAPQLLRGQLADCRPGWRVMDGTTAVDAEYEFIQTTRCRSLSGRTEQTMIS